jgi:hypothetical protein
MKPREARDRGGTWVALLGLTVMLLILYVASVGPIVMLSEGTGIGRNVVRVVYTPLVWLHDKTPLRGPLEWYVGLFGIR